MEAAPGPAEFFSHWVASPAWVVVLVAVTAAYSWAFRLARVRRFEHPAWRLALFVAGVAVVGLAVLSPVAYYGRDVLWVDFTGFLLITMIAPPLILLGAPLTLAFRASRPAGRVRLRHLYRSKFAAIITFPVATWLTFAVVTYLWQFTELTDIAARNTVARFAQQASLLVVALLFWTPAIAADPLRWRLAYPLRALYVFVEMTHKGLFGGMFLSMQTAMHGEFARNAPAWAPAPITDQRIAILILWIGGNMVFVVALIGIVLGWAAYEQRNQRRTDLRLKLQNEKAHRKRAALDKVFTKGV